MLMRFDAMLNGVSFSNLDPAVILRDVEEMPAYEDIETAQRGVHAGTRLTSRIRRKLSLRLIYNVREYDPDRRSAVMDKIAAWAGVGGWLVLSSRPNQQIYVHVDTPPAQKSALRWAEDMELVLTAYERPFFAARWPVTAIITDNGTINPLGTVPEAYVEVEARNAGNGVLTDITFTCADTSIHLAGLALQPQETVQIFYTDKDVMVIMAGETSALANRTAESHDDLIAYTRKSNEISVTADQPVNAVFRARGRYL